MSGQVRAVQLAVKVVGELGKIQSTPREAMQGKQRRPTAAKAMESDLLIAQRELFRSGFRHLHLHDE